MSRELCVNHKSEVEEDLTAGRLVAAKTKKLGDNFIYL